MTTDLTVSRSKSMTITSRITPGCGWKTIHSTMASSTFVLLREMWSE
jgi:hypothetical protein